MLLKTIITIYISLVYDSNLSTSFKLTGTSGGKTLSSRAGLCEKEKDF